MTPLRRLRQMSEIVDFMVGKSDNLDAFQMKALLEQQELTGITVEFSSTQIEVLQDAIRTSDLAAQQIKHFGLKI